MLFVCSLRSLPSSQPMLPSHTHTPSSDIKKVPVLDQLQAPPGRVIDYERYGKVEQRRLFQPRLIGDRMASPIAVQRASLHRQATFWDTHRSSCSGELRQATDRFTLVDEKIIEVVYEQAREVQRFAGDNGVVDTIQDEAEEKTPLPEKFAQSGLREVLTLQSSLSAKAAVWCFHALSAKAGATFSWFCSRVMSREEISMPAKRWPTSMLQGRFPDLLKL